MGKTYRKEDGERNRNQKKFKGQNVRKEHLARFKGRIDTDEILDYIEEEIDMMDDEWAYEKYVK